MSENRQKMNETYQRILSGLLLNAERDVRLARAGTDEAARAKANVRLETLRAALEIYAASHKLAYGERPWPREERT
ncbi:hypothetical protein [Deinococcus sp. PESE-13]